MTQFIIIAAITSFLLSLILNIINTIIAYKEENQSAFYGWLSATSFSFILLLNTIVKLL